MRDSCFRHIARYISQLCRKILERKWDKSEIYTYIKERTRAEEAGIKYKRKLWILKNRAQDTEKMDMSMTLGDRGEKGRFREMLKGRSKNSHSNNPDAAKDASSCPFLSHRRPHGCFMIPPNLCGGAL